MLSLDSCDIFSGSLKNRTPEYYVSVADVLYPLDLSLVRHLDLHRLLNCFNSASNLSFAFKVPVGALDIPMSRESILNSEKNLKIISEVFEKTLKDIKQHVDSLDINTKGNLLTFYQELQKANKDVDRGAVSFAIRYEEEAFKEQEKEMIEYHDSLPNKPSFTENSKLAYANVFRRHGFQTPYYDILYLFLRKNLKIFKYSPDTFPSRVPVRDHWSKSSHYSLEMLTEDDSQIFFMSETLPKGVSLASLSKYLEKKKRDDSFIYLFCFDLQKDLKLFTYLVNVLKAAQKAQFNVETITLEGTITDQILIDHHNTVKASLVKTPRSSRQTPSVVPGFRIFNIGYVQPNLSVYIPGHKVKTIYDANDKAVPAGPAYLSKDELSKKIILISTDNALYPFEFEEGVFQYGCPGLTSLYKEFVVVAVQARSFKKTLDLFLDQKLEVYHSENKYKISKIEFEKAPSEIKESLLEPYLFKMLQGSFLGDTVNWHSLRVSSDSLHVKFLFRTVKKCIEQLPDSIFKQTFKSILSQYKEDELLPFLRKASYSVPVVVKSVYKNYEEEAQKTLEQVSIDVEQQMFEYLTDLSDFVYVVETGSFQKDFINKFINHLKTN